ncbi:c-type cytochrome [Shewanella sp. D64]|uniref:cytochrome-c peroxidase n=1 Tax=unclassified Shewanella TaxID=196818 RepID=UPI0022BA4971|nr:MULTISPECIES: cytochrome c peroxidase [unclassified Shewanella]MEC4724557.1 c-type cytochrome [Shewanella sp. D64]MEC4736666.1 c-type cytochrome [Shewanella sp. E94]WBJ94664.1 c-type cytochrome [Shewanella sp. MTB7]
MKHTVFCLFKLLLICNSALAEVPDNSIHSIAIQFFEPLPNKMPGNKDDNDIKIALGKKLYFDNQLSINKTQSCNSCHNLLDTDSNPGSGTDNLAVSVGALGVSGTRNSPTTWNAGFQFSQFWDGRAKNLIEQAKFPILNPIEMALPSEREAITRLTDTGYLDLFIKAYPNQVSPLNFNNILGALSAFQRTLISEDRFDQFLKGDKNILSPKEKTGLKTFITAGCVACHNGPLLGGQMFTRMGVVNPYPNKVDKGRAHITQDPADNFLFKVPPLRNVSKTAPYFHDGAGITLEQAVKDTGFHQLGITLTNEETQGITSFLNTLENLKVVTR